jgi:hypothetical protein
MLTLHRTITKILPVTAVVLWAVALPAQTPAPGKSDKPKNPPPYANQPPTGIGTPPEGTTPHDTPDLDKSKKQPNAKAKKKPAKKKEKNPTP